MGRTDCEDVGLDKQVEAEHVHQVPLPSVNVTNQNKVFYLKAKARIWR